MGQRPADLLLPEAQKGFQQPYHVLFLQSRRIRDHSVKESLINHSNRSRRTPLLVQNQQQPG
eukprot:1360642-Amorphochlora_amoeboformis.AAC.2